MITSRLVLAMGLPVSAKEGHFCVLPTRSLVVDSVVENSPYKTELAATIAQHVKRYVGLLLASILRG